MKRITSMRWPPGNHWEIHGPLVKTHREMAEVLSDPHSEECSMLYEEDGETGHCLLSDLQGETVQVGLRQVAVPKGD